MSIECWHKDLSTRKNEFFGGCRIPLLNLLGQGEVTGWFNLLGGNKNPVGKIAIGFDFCNEVEGEEEEEEEEEIIKIEVLGTSSLVMEGLEEGFGETKGFEVGVPTEDEIGGGVEGERAGKELIESEVIKNVVNSEGGVGLGIEVDLQDQEESSGVFSPRFAVREKEYRDSLNGSDLADDSGVEDDLADDQNWKAIPLKRPELDDPEEDLDTNLQRNNNEPEDVAFLKDNFGLERKKDFGKKIKKPRVIVYDEGGKYVGDIDSNNDEHGNGILYWNDKKIRYVGEWNHSRREGKGVSYWPSGKVLYIGSWHNDDYSGLGTEYSMDGRIIYRGEWNHGQYNGTGKLYNKDGEMITKGFWRDNILITATLTSTQTNSDYQILQSPDNPSIIICQCVQKKDKPPKKEGKGVQYNFTNTLTSSGRFEGYWVNDKKSGHGSIHDKNGDVVFVGDFAADEISGSGKSYYANGNIEYDGQWKDSMSHGFGISYFESGTIQYQGYWVRDLRWGKGVSFWENSNMEYNGGWVGDRRE